MEKSRYVGSQLQISRIFSGFFFSIALSRSGTRAATRAAIIEGLLQGRVSPALH